MTMSNKPNHNVRSASIVGISLMLTMAACLGLPSGSPSSPTGYPKDEVEQRLLVARASLQNNPTEPIFVGTLSQAVGLAFTSGKVARGELDGPALLKEVEVAAERAAKAHPTAAPVLDAWRGLVYFASGDADRARPLLANRSKWDADLFAGYVALAHARKQADLVVEVCRAGYHQLGHQSYDFFAACVAAAPELQAGEALARFASAQDVAWYVEENRSRTTSGQRNFQEAQAESASFWNCHNRCERYYNGCGDSAELCTEKRQSCDATCK